MCSHLKSDLDDNSSGDQAKANGYHNVNLPLKRQTTRVYTWGESCRERRETRLLVVGSFVQYGRELRSAASTSHLDFVTSPVSQMGPVEDIGEFIIPRAFFLIRPE